LLRDRSRIWTFVAKSLAIAAILVLADARFGFYLCIVTVAIYRATPFIRTTMTMLLAPFVVTVALAAYAAVGWQGTWENTIAGRFLWSGYLLSDLDALQVFGLQVNGLFTSGFAGDSGYGYALAKAGLVGLAAIWGLFVYSQPLDTDAARFKNFTAFYVIFLLAISTSLFSIKTSALLWFLYGTLNNPDRLAWAHPLVARAGLDAEPAGEQP
jgi:putative polymerase